MLLVHNDDLEKNHGEWKMKEFGSMQESSD